MRCSHTDLLQGLAGQVCLRHGESVALRGEVPHLAVGGPVVQSHSGQVVEGSIQVVGHIGCTRNKNNSLLVITSSMCQHSEDAHLSQS